MPNNQRKEERPWWEEEEFDKMFDPDGDTINSILSMRSVYDDGKYFKEEEEEYYLAPMRKFISRVLAEERRRMAEMVRKMGDEPSMDSVIVERIAKSLEASDKTNEQGN